MFDSNLKVWRNGEIVSWSEATLHAASHVVHYGSSIFEGIRAYATSDGPAIFRLQDHLDRFYTGAKIYGMDIPFRSEVLREACFELLRVNDLSSAYIRPVIFRGLKVLGIDPTSCPVETVILAWNWGAYLGETSVQDGVDVCVSSWRRMAPDTFPSMVKAGGHYTNAQLIKIEALKNGYHEGIALDYSGLISEGPGQNIFVVYRDTLLTPPMSASILPGITRDSLLELAEYLRIPHRTENLPREMLYAAQEVFFAGTAVEITPIRSVDRKPVGNGKPGPMTRKLQNMFFDVVHGRVAEFSSWLERPVSHATRLEAATTS
jgi:branched-chain amino acid aminotransferase